MELKESTMNTRNFGGMARSPGINVGMIVRVTLATFAVVGSLVMAYVLMNGGHKARAVGTTITTLGQPLGEALDTQGHLWVAEQGTTSQPTGYIGEFTLAAPLSKSVQTPLPTTSGYSAPAFLALDASGNAWFTEPATGEIGELSGTTFQNFPVLTRRSAPTDLTFDSNGNIWFTEQNGNNIGFLNVKTKQVVETAVTQAKAAPYGIINVGGEIWFTENKQPTLGHFHPTTTGTITINYITTKANPHLLASDSSGNIWFSEGANDSIGEYSATTKRVQDFSLASAVCGAAAANAAAASQKTQTAGTNPTPVSTKTPSTSPTPVGTGTPGTCSNAFVAGIFVDSNNQVWFDESQFGRIGVFNPSTSQAVAVNANNNPSDGLVVDTIGNVWASSQTTALIIKVPTSAVSGSGGGGTSSAPVNTTWYFAEGRVGKGFREYLTVSDPTANACAVNIQYLYTMDGSATPATKTVSLNIAAASRATESVNNDLGLTDSSTSAASLAAIVTVNTSATPTCTGVVAERPMYFSNFHGISSGTDVLGSTKLSTTYYFADVPTGTSYTCYITILNPQNTTANVTVNYFANGSQVQTQTLAVPANSRGTITPSAGMPQHVAATVTSDQSVMVERPVYFTGVNGVSGAYDVVGAPKSASDWLFAEGYTGAGYQEYLTLANLDPANTASVTVTLKSGTGATNATNLTLGPKSQTIWNVNAANNFSGSTPEVSVEVTAASSGSVSGAVRLAARKTPTATSTPGTPTATSAPGTPTATPTPAATGIVVQREIYFTYKHTLSQQAMGGTDVMGQVGPASHSAYSFAEGYTNTGYNTWLTIQNPTANTETISVILVNGLSQTSTQTYTVTANSRYTVDVTALVQKVFTAGTSSSANSISMTVQTSNGAAFVAERPMYWNTSGVSSFVTAGGSDIIGYVGG
jgi:virginiamycin B lyase